MGFEWVIKHLTPTDTDNNWCILTPSQILPNIYQLFRALLLQFITLSACSMHYLPNTSHPKHPEAPLLWNTWLRYLLPCHKKGVFPCSSQSVSWLFLNHGKVAQGMLTESGKTVVVQSYSKVVDMMLLYFASGWPGLERKSTITQLTTAEVNTSNTNYYGCFLAAKV